MDIKAGILSTLAYFDMFQYPLTEQEIHFFLPMACPADEFHRAIRELKSSNRLFVHQGLHTLTDNIAAVNRRKAGNALASRMLVTARRIGGFLYRFPFVRSVSISGSLSKHYADKHSDIDLFIIVASNRLWIARTILHLVKKISFLFFLQDWFCMNYFIDEACLEIPEQNLYTAIEVVTLIPVSGAKTFERFVAANAWTRSLLPNGYGHVAIPAAPAKSRVKNAIEWVLNKCWPDRLDAYLMSVTARRWGKKTSNGKRNIRGMVMSMDASRHMARPEPGQYQQDLLHAHQRKVKAVSVAL